MKEKSVKEGDWNDWSLSTKTGKKLKVTELQEQEESLSNCWSFIVVSCNGMVKLS